MEQQIVRPINSISFILKEAILDNNKELISNIYSYLIDKKVIDPFVVDEKNNMIDFTQTDENKDIIS